LNETFVFAKKTNAEPGVRALCVFDNHCFCCGPKAVMTE